MRVITWNCGGAFRRKFHQLDNCDADIIVIQECEDPSQSSGEYFSWARNYLWIGSNKNKGIGIFARKRFDLKKLQWDDEGLQLFLPCTINGSLSLIAVWTKYANSPSYGYMGQFWKYLQLHKDKINRTDCIICGDFNSHVRWDQKGRWWNHSDVVRELGEMDIHSVYHRVLNLKQGNESKPTFYMHRKTEKPFHIDYAFASNRLISQNTTLDIGNYEKWLEHSDHMPLIFAM